jgi:RNA polymerase sigma factor (sigma-70 family)
LEARIDMSANPALAADGNEDRDAHDRRLLAQIAAARARGDELGHLRAKTAMGDLLAPYWPEVRRVVAWRLKTIAPQPADVDEIASKVFERLVNVLSKKTSFGDATFRVLVFKNAQWEAIEFWRRRKRAIGREADLGGEVPETAAAEVVALVHAEVIAEIIEELAPREQRIVVERWVVGLSPQEIADRIGIARGAVDTACSRALAKLRRSPRVIAVRDRLRETV